jgi:hypothetical protein
MSGDGDRAANAAGERCMAAGAYASQPSARSATIPTTTFIERIRKSVVAVGARPFVRCVSAKSVPRPQEDPPRRPSDAPQHSHSFPFCCKAALYFSQHPVGRCALPPTPPLQTIGVVTDGCAPGQASQSLIASAWAPAHHSLLRRGCRQSMGRRLLSPRSSHPY